MPPRHLFRNAIAMLSLAFAAGLLGLTLGLYERSRLMLEEMVSVTGRYTWLVHPSSETGVQPPPLPTREDDLAPLRGIAREGGIALETGITRFPTGRLNYAINGVSKDYFAVRGFRLGRGREFVGEDEAVVGHRLGDLLGKSVEVDGLGYRVVGVLEPVPLHAWDDRTADSVVYLPLGNYVGPVAGATRLYLSAKPEGFAAAKGALEDWMQSRGVRGYSVVRLADLLGLELRQTVAAVLGGALGFGLFAALLTASTGLVAFYLTRALERVRQIAVRRALGASRRAVFAEELGQTLVWVPGGFLLSLPLMALGNLWMERTLQLSAWPGPLTLLLLALGIAGLVILSALFPTLWAVSQPPANALRGLLSSLPQGRLWLAGAGLLFGVAGLISQATLSRTAVAEAERLVGRFGDRVGVFASVFDGENFGDPRGLISLNREDYQALRESALARQFSGTAYVRTVDLNLEAEGRSVGASLKAYEGEYLRLVGAGLTRGRWPNRLGEIALGQLLARQIYGDADPLGRRINTLGRDWSVVGVFRGAANAVPGNLASDQAAVPGEYVRAPGFGFILAEVRPGLEPSVVLAEGARLLSSRYDLTQLQPLRAFKPTDFAPPERKVLDRLTGVYGMLAVCLLALGGAGLAAQMLVGVSLRQREIGIRRAVGASHRGIFWLFLEEALNLAFIASIAGVAVGIGIAWLVVQSQRANLVLAEEWIFFGPGAGVLIAVLFGTIPALLAARLPPAQVMHEE